MYGSLRSWGRAVVVVLVPLIFAVAVAGAASASPAGASGTGRLCVPVRLSAFGQDLGADSQGVLHTEATVSLGGVPVAGTYASFTPGALTGSSLAFSGPIVFTPVVGSATLTATVNGAVDLSSGSFTATSSALTGTAALASVTGRLVFRGTEDLTTGAFTEIIVGRVCTRVH